MTPLATKHYSDIQEKKIARALGWKQVSASGARPLNPGDVISNDFIGECKTHTRPDRDIEFKETVWNKIEDEAWSQFKLPILFVDDGSQDLNKTWCMVSILPYKEHIVIDYPLKHTKNIKFSSKDLEDILDTYDKPVIFNVKDLRCYICKFTDFQLVYEV